MAASPSMCYVWLYLSHGMEALPQLIQMLSVPSRCVIAGDDSQMIFVNGQDQRESGLQYYKLTGDFLLSCDVRLLGWTLPRVHAQLLQLSTHGLRIAMIDDSSDSPFACVLFEAGKSRRVTVVQNDDTDEVKLYPVG